MKHENRDKFDKGEQWLPCINIDEEDQQKQQDWIQVGSKQQTVYNNYPTYRA